MQTPANARLSRGDTRDVKNQLLIGDALTVLRTLPDASVQMCVTSPPYWGLRDYGIEGQLGTEATLSEYVSRLVAIFGEVRRTLCDDGTCWINLGDTLINKELAGAPWRTAFAIQNDGWRLRSEIVWEKPNTMPESVTDRPTRAHEYIFLLTKNPRYFYDADAIREPFVGKNEHDRTGGKYSPPGQTAHSSRLNGSRGGYKPEGRNARTVWAINTKSYKGAHFAVFPEELPRRCILAGSRPGDTVLDPFAGSGTTCAVAKSLGRDFIGIELNADYKVLAEKRISEAVGE